MKPGQRLKSAVCDTEILVIRGNPANILYCGGSPMVEARIGEQIVIDLTFAEGTQAGKRYEDEAGTTQVLCTKSGKGTLSLDGKPLRIMAAKPLPSSD